MKFVCVYKKDPKNTYGLDYVQKLYNAFLLYTDLPISDFVCLSDDPFVINHVSLTRNYPTWWSKMELFAPEFQEDIFYVDLDTIITNDIQPLLNKCEALDTVIMLEDFYYSNRLASGVMWLPKQYRDIVWKEWIKNPQGIMEQCGHLGDQKFIGDMYQDCATTFQSFTNEIISYKKHILNDLQTGVESIICYHGRPRPRDTNWSINK